MKQEINDDPQISASGIQYKEFIFNVDKRRFIEHPKYFRQLQLRGLLYRHSNVENRNTTYRKSISTCAWMVVMSPSTGPYFITSDNHGISIGRDNLYYDTPFIDDFTFYLPISSRYFFIISDQF